MLYKTNLFIILLYFFFVSTLYTKEYRIGILCKDKTLYNELYKGLSSKYNITNNLKNADLIICGSKKYIKKCCNINKRVIAVNFNYFEIDTLKHKNILAYFPKNFDLKEVASFLKKNLGSDKNLCVLTHNKCIKSCNNITVFHINEIGELPYTLNFALKKCDLIIGIPDKYIFNYFSSRFIIKKIVLNGKSFTGFSRDMIKLGALYSFEVDYKKYVEKIVKSINKYFFKKKEKKIIFTGLKELKIYQNSKMVRNTK